MRTDAADRQSHRLLKALNKLVNLEPELARHMPALSDAILESYCLGAIEALERAPWETAEVAFRGDRVTPDMLAATCAQGWEPWDITGCMFPPKAGEAYAQHSPGYIVRFKRRMAPEA